MNEWPPEEVMKTYYSRSFIATSSDEDGSKSLENIAEDWVSVGNRTTTPEHMIPISAAIIGEIHDKDYVKSTISGQPLLSAESNELEWNPGLYNSEKMNVAGILAATDYALMHNSVSGTICTDMHGAYHTAGSKFSTFNGIAAAAYLYTSGMYKSNMSESNYSHRVINNCKVVILDFGGDSGGGTVDILRHLKIDDSVYQFDVSTSGFNFYEEDETHRIYDVDDEASYASVVMDIITHEVPWDDTSLVIYVAGNDDSSLVSTEMLKVRDSEVFNACVRNGVPCAFTVHPNRTNPSETTNTRNTMSAANFAFEAIKGVLA